LLKLKGKMLTKDTNADFGCRCQVYEWRLGVDVSDFAAVAWGLMGCELIQKKMQGSDDPEKFGAPGDGTSEERGEVMNLCVFRS